MPQGDEVRREVIIKARRETVFRYFTDPALMTSGKGGWRCWSRGLGGFTA